MALAFVKFALTIWCVMVFTTVLSTIEFVGKGGGLSHNPDTRQTGKLLLYLGQAEAQEFSTLSPVTLNTEGVLAQVNNLLLTDGTNLKSQLEAIDAMFLSLYPITQSALGQIDLQPNMGVPCAVNSVLTPYQSLKTWFNELEYYIETSINNDLYPPVLTLTNVTVSNSTMLDSTVTQAAWNMQTYDVISTSSLTAATVEDTTPLTLPASTLRGGFTWDLGVNDVVNVAGIVTTGSVTVQGASTLTGISISNSWDFSGDNITNCAFVLFGGTGKLNVTGGAAARTMLVDPAGSGLAVWKTPNSMGILNAGPVAPSTTQIPYFADSVELPGSNFVWTGSHWGNPTGSVSMAGNNGSTSLLGPTTINGDVEVKAHILTAADATITASGFSVVDALWTNSVGAGSGTWELVADTFPNSGGVEGSAVEWASASTLTNSQWSLATNTLSLSTGALACSELKADTLTTPDIFFLNGARVVANTFYASGLVDLFRQTGNFDPIITVTGTLTVAGSINITHLVINAVTANTVYTNFYGIETGGDFVCDQGNIACGGVITAGGGATASTTISGGSFSTTTNHVTATAGNLLGLNTVSASVQLNQATFANAVMSSASGGGECKWTSLPVSTTANVLPRTAAGGTLADSAVFNAGSSVTFTRPIVFDAGDLQVADDKVVAAGTGGELGVTYTGGSGHVTNTTGDLYVTADPASTNIVVKLGTVTNTTNCKVVDSADTTSWGVGGDGTWLSRTTTAGVLASDAQGVSFWKDLDCAQTFETFVVASAGTACNHETDVTYYDFAVPLPSASLFLTVDTEFDSSLIISENTHVYVVAGATLTWGCTIPSGLRVTISGPGNVTTTNVSLVGTNSILDLNGGLTVDLSGVSFIIGLLTCTDVTLTNAGAIQVGGDSNVNTVRLNNVDVSDSWVATLISSTGLAELYAEGVTGGWLTVNGTTIADIFVAKDSELGKLPTAPLLFDTFFVVGCSFHQTITVLSSFNPSLKWFLANCVFYSPVTLSGVNFSLYFQRCIFHDTITVPLVSAKTLVFQNCVFEGNCSLTSSSLLVINGCTFNGTATFTSNVILSLTGNEFVSTCAFTTSSTNGLIANNNFGGVFTLSSTQNLAVNLSNNRFRGGASSITGALNGKDVLYGNYFDNDFDLIDVNDTTDFIVAANVCQDLSKTGSSTGSFVSTNKLATTSGFTVSELPAGYNL